MGKQYKIVSIDTDALSFAHQHRSPDKAIREVALRTRNYLATAGQKDIRVVLPMMTLSEYLCVHDQANFDRVINELEEDFILADFNHLAAKELAAMRKDKEKLAQARHNTGQPKDAVKYDQIIAAISLAAGAKHILTGNPKDYKTLTCDRLIPIDIRQLPMPSTPLPMFDSDEEADPSTQN